MAADPAGYQQAVAELEAASPDRRRAYAAQQAHADKFRMVFQDIMETAQPSPDELRTLLLANLTTKPPFNLKSMGLTWMQRSPNDWQGWYPEQCQRVAELAGIGEEVS